MGHKLISRLTLAVVVIATIMLAGTALGGPAIKVAEPSFDFGKTVQHVKITHDFWIKSVGDQPLVITKVVPGCGCTEAPLRDSVLAPGDSTVLSITFSTGSYARNVTKTPYLKTNVSDEQVQLTIKTEIVVEPEKMGPLKITPFGIDISQTGKTEHRRGVFLIENLSDRDLKLKVVDEAREYFETTLPDIVKAGETAEGVVVVRKEAVGSVFKKSLTFELNDAGRTRYTLPVSRLTSATAASTK